jgi:hypothetical protein
MYEKAVKKLNLNRQFEKAIKEVAIDCNLNKNGNIVRLDECYTAGTNDKYTLHYENYQTGERFIRLNTPVFYTLNDILKGVAKNSSSFRFRSLSTNEEITLNKSLIVPENINCEAPKYSFTTENIPSELITMSLNKELIPYLMRLKLSDIKGYFYGVQDNRIRTADPKLRQKLTVFLSKNEQVQRQNIIDGLDQMGIGDVVIWQFYPLDQLKSIARELNIKF